MDSLKQLETKIGDFLKAYDRLQQTCTQLQLAAKEQEKQLAEANARLKQFEKERDEVRGRLDRVLKQLDVLNLK